MIVSFNSLDKTQEEKGGFSREGRIMNNKFSNIRSSIKSIERGKSKDGSIKKQNKSINNEEESEDDIFVKTVTNKIVKIKKRSSHLEHPLAGHFNKSHLQKHLEGG